jgi:hypothetical protein
MENVKGNINYTTKGLQIDVQINMIGDISVYKV